MSSTMTFSVSDDGSKLDSYDEISRSLIYTKKLSKQSSCGEDNSTLTYDSYTEDFDSAHARYILTYEECNTRASAIKMVSMYIPVQRSKNGYRLRLVQ